MAVIDAHAHIYPDKIAARAVDAIGEFYLVDMYGKGTAEHLLSVKDRSPSRISSCIRWPRRRVRWRASTTS